MLNFFFKLRLNAIKKSNLILSANPFSGVSLNQINWAKKNRELNRAWFFRNYFKLKNKLTEEQFDSIIINLGFNPSEKMELEMRLKNII